MTKTTIASVLKINPKTVTKWRNRTSAKDMPRPGAPCVLSEEAKAFIVVNCQDKWHASTRWLARLLASDDSFRISGAPSRSTISRYVRSTDWGKTAYRIQIRPLLSAKNISDRVQFCNMLRELGYCDSSAQGALLLNNVLYTDETIVELYPRPNSQNTRIRTSHPDDRVSMNIPKHGLKIMVAGGMTGTGLTKLHIVDAGATITGNYYRDRILPVYLEAARRHDISDSILENSLFTAREHAVFMQDGAPAHTANLTMRYLAQHFRTIWSRDVWPGNSPDLNPIEHLWPILQESVFVTPKPRNRAELILRVEQAWAGISFSLLQRLVLSVPERIRTCHDNNGGRSGY
jgi:transposase